MRHQRSYYQHIMEVMADKNAANDGVEQFIALWVKRKANAAVLTDAVCFYLYGFALKRCAVNSSSTLVRSHLKTFRKIVLEAEDIASIAMTSLNTSIEGAEK